MQSSTFEDLSLHPRILKALAEEGYAEPTPIQIEAIPVLLDGGDLMATAQTGTGKTAAFALPILQYLYDEHLDGYTPHGPDRLRVLVLTPTRELALQVEANIRAYARHLPLRSAVVLGGVSSRPQIAALGRSPDILVATPGRLLDLLQQRRLRLDCIEILVLDEADRMLDMGFIDEVRRIVDRVPRDRQTMLLSATLSPQVATLARDMLYEPVTVEVSPPATVVTAIEQQAMFVNQADKRSLLLHLLKNRSMRRALVFTRTKHGAERLALHLARNGVQADSIHSNKTQGARQRALAAFETGELQALIATDIVARGIDVPDISHVINFDVPSTPEGYVHRVGRTARAGAVGVALSLCDAVEVATLRVIQSVTDSPLRAIEDQPYHSAAVAALFSGNGKKSRSASVSGTGWRSFRPRFGSARMTR